MQLCYNVYEIWVIARILKQLLGYFWVVAREFCLISYWPVVTQASDIQIPTVGFPATSV